MKLINLKGKLKVGQVVREVRKGNETSCNELINGNKTNITGINENSVFFNGCIHGWSSDIELDITPSWDNLSMGDRIVHSDRYEIEILEVGTSGKTFLTSSFNNFKKTGSWYHIEEAQAIGWKLKDSVEPTQELTLEQISEKFNIPLKDLRIKDK